MFYTQRERERERERERDHGFAFPTEVFCLLWNAIRGAVLSAPSFRITSFKSSYVPNRKRSTSRLYIVTLLI